MMMKPQRVYSVDDGGGYRNTMSEDDPSGQFYERWEVELEMGKLQARLAEAERLLRSVASVGYEENGTLFADIDAFLGTADSASPRESERG